MNKKHENWLFFSHSSDLGGAELSLLPVIDAALQAGKHVTVALPRDGKFRTELEKRPDIDIIIRKTQKWMTGKFAFLTGPIRLLIIANEAKSMSNWLSRSAYTKVIVNTSTIPAPLWAAKRNKIPTVLFVHELIRTNRDLRSFLPKSLIISNLQRNANLIVVPSNAVAIEMGGSPHVFAPEILKPLKSIAELTQLHSSGPHSPMRLVMLGRIHSSKGVYEAVESVWRARDRGVFADLTLYGDIDSRTMADLSGIIKEKRLDGAVVIRPPMSNIDAIFENADITLVLSKAESFGRVARESISRGVPVIGLDIPATRDAIPNGCGALVSEPSQEIPGVLAGVQSGAIDYLSWVKSCLLNSELIVATDSQTKELIEVINSLP